MIVHLPIGILLFAAVLEMLVLVKKDVNLHMAIRVALLTGAGSAALAALSGSALAAAGGYDPQTLFWHRWLGISIGVLALLAWWAKRKQKGGGTRYPAVAGQWLLLGLLLLIGITGHLGGNLTHGSTYLTAYMPAPVKVLFAGPDPSPPRTALPAHVDSVLVYKHLVAPMLEARCGSCHNAGKARGGLSLASPAAIMKGGKGGPALAPGNVAESELIRRVTLPHTSSKFMPPKNQPPLSHVEVRLLQWWVSQGADFKKKAAAMEADENMRYLLAVYLGIDTEAVAVTGLPEAPAATPQALQDLRAAGILARMVSENSNLLDVSFVMARTASRQQRQEQFKKLLQVKEQVYWLDISSCGLSNEDLQVLGQLSNLAKLHLQQNNIGDAGIAYLRNLKHLEYLNMYQNPLSDKGLQGIQQLAALKKINLWQTQVTEKGVAHLTQVKQHLVVNY